MKAARIHEYGDATVIRIDEIPHPVAGEGQVLVAVHAASLNPFDTVIRSGAMRQQIPLTLPITLGGDIAGEVIAVGAGVRSFTVGDSVYGQAAAVAGNSGAFAEYAVTAAAQIAHAPKNMDATHAAALPLVGVSALQALTDHLALQPGQKLFIHGGAGGVGRIAAQFAKHRGAYVVTTATGDSVEDLLTLGADEVIDYKVQDFTALPHDFDAVFDTVGKDDFARTFALLKHGGTAVSMVAQPDRVLAEERGIAALMQQTRITTARLDELTRLVEAGVIEPRIGEVFPLDDVQQAFEARESGSDGKVILVINPVD